MRREAVRAESFYGLAVALELGAGPGVDALDVFGC